MKEKPKAGRRGKSRAKNRGGRPEYVPTIEDRLSVEQMKFCGEPESVIARALRIDVKTLRKHFDNELANGHAFRRREVIGHLFTQAQDGNVSATKRLEEMGRVAGAEERINSRPAKEPKLGKKQEQQQAAERVAGKFEPPAPPKLVVSNP